MDRQSGAFAADPCNTAGHHQWEAANPVDRAYLANSNVLAVIRARQGFLDSQAPQLNSLGQFNCLQRGARHSAPTIIVVLLPSGEDKRHVANALFAQVEEAQRVREHLCRRGLRHLCTCRVDE
jgi:hypothetical protein